MAKIAPKKMVTPMVLRLSPPAPPQTISGIAPAAAEIEVMMIGRSLREALSITASRIDRPSSRSWLANSTIRMPFLAAMPTRMISPIWL